jgi:molybdenum cofactor cytidylyltransferase
MGRPKALLDFGGRCALVRLLEVYAGLPDPIVVLGPDHEAVRAACDLSRVRTVLNLRPGSGQTESLQAALRILPSEAEAFLFQPVDVVLVEPLLVGRLTEAWRRCTDPGIRVFVPSHAGRRGHPVLCRRPVAEDLLRLPPGAPAREALFRDPAAVLHVEAESAEVLMDMDTPEDYARCLEAFRASRRGR